MDTRAAILREQPGRWEVHTVELDPPRDREVLVRILASGLCHSDDHFAKGDISVGHLPFCGGHEAAGIVEAVGPGVSTLREGDHIVTAFIPSCGHCRWCASGMQALCDNGALMLEGTQLDGTFRMHLGDEDVAQAGLLSAFAEHTVVPEISCIKIPPDVSPGDVVLVLGTGGIGINAVQGARHAGAGRIIAVDPIELKRTKALELGATDAFAAVDEAADLARSLTNGQGADSAIVCIGVPTGQDLAAAFAAIRKAGTVVMTAAAPETTVGIPVGLLELSMFQKRIQGALYGMCAPAKDVPRLLSLWRDGRLKLEELVTRTYALDELNQGYADMHAGVNIRGVLDLAELGRMSVAAASAVAAAA
jgi:S-(hydroxymethyl)glutathione dehydrogenase/alcohol dehydrogenase